MGASYSCSAGSDFLDTAAHGYQADVALSLQDDIQLLKHSSLLQGNTAWHVAAKANRLIILQEMVRYAAALSLPYSHYSHH